MSESIILRSFASGELAPGLYARADLAKYVTGARTLRNFIVRRHGGAAARPGFKRVGSMKATGKLLKPFVWKAANASFVIEVGDNYFRFIKDGAYVTVSGVVAYNGATAYVPGDLASSGGINYYCIAATTGNAPPNATYWYALTGSTYEIPHPWLTGAFLGTNTVRWTQQGLTVSITYSGTVPYELTYAGTTRWILSPVTTAPTQAPPTLAAGTAGAVGTRTFKYVVTAAAVETYEESNPSNVATVALAADPTNAAPNALTWTAAAGAAEYYVYSDGGFGNGVYGYLGKAASNAFNDVGQVPDFSVTPPIVRTLFASTNNYPHCAVTWQQRRIYASTANNTEAVYASRVGFPHNFGIRSPLQDDDAVTFTLASEEIQPIQHLVTLKQGLVILTDSREWVITGDEAGVLKPTAINANTHGYWGSSDVKPVVIGNSILYVQTQVKQLRDLRFDERVDGLGGRDLTLYAAHLFESTTITNIAYQANPDSIVWAVLADGTLVGLTYIREEDVWGWHRHDTQDGDFKDVCVIPESAGDAVYVAVDRGGSTYTVERMAARVPATLADTFRVDAGITYSGVSTTAITGLSHLEGQDVYAFCDGARVEGPLTVVGGAITLTTACTKAQVGLPIISDLEPLDLDVSGSDVRDKKKKVSNVALLLEASFRGFSIGPDADSLLEHQLEPWQVDTAPFTGKVEVAVGSSAYGDSGRFFLRHVDPTPLTVLGLIPHVTIGG